MFGREAVGAGYWDAYRLAVLAGGDPPWVAVTGIERRPDLARAALQRRPVAYLVRPHDAALLATLDEAGRQGISRLRDDAVGRYRLVVLDGAAPGLAAVRPSPPRWWQMLAAAGAGLLFVGTLAFMALAPLISRRWPGILGAAFPAPVSAPTRD